MNELSPRRFPRSPVVPPRTPPQWKKPQDVMRERKIRIKQNALLARINRSPSHDIATTVSSTNSVKRKNPFSKCKEVKEPVLKRVKPEPEVPSESSLLEILGFSESKDLESTINSHSWNCSRNAIENKENEINGSSFKALPIDWTLRTKMRFISLKPFPWTQMLKTCEEASGITGFVRCLEFNNERSGAGLDSSPNSRFHQSCLFWQHPQLPWLDLYPRHSLRKADKQPFLISPAVKEALYKDWSNSFRSLFQLVRTRHCPYFYVVANTFTCLFRAAGINGIGETTAYVCPTSGGLRKLLREEGINFSMPLRDSSKKRRSNGTSENEEEEVEEETEEIEQEEDEKEEKDWLASLGIEESEIGKIKTAEEASSLKIEDKNDDSLVLVDGSEVHALFNFLINCKSAIATTGPLAGIPPTLISPVAFTGGSLLPLKVRESTVKQDNERFYTIEVRGPILPNTVQNLCNILQENLDTFSVTFANVDFTKAYTLCKGPNEAIKNSPSKQTNAFSMESLKDSGLDTKLLAAFCSENLQAFDSIRWNG
ncbi:protein downstream neighbor of son homolog isoform X2 [Halyomorpha halys]|nr:protein downstream neighbor of son homolog isoform X2 [Halyomorpha halys]